MENEHELIALILWIIGSLIVGIIAHRRGKSWVGHVFLSLILSPLLGVVFVLLSRPPGTAADQAHADESVVGAESIHTASTSILTPEQAAALRVRAEEEERKSRPSADDMAALQNADTNEFKPGEIEIIKQDDEGPNGPATS